MRKKKTRTLAEIKGDVWKLFSSYIRKRDSDWKGFGKCCTCGVLLQIPSVQAHAGHFIHGSTKRSYFEPKNVHLQCRSCNFFKNGARDVYALFLVKKYGKGIIEELHAINKDKRPWTKKELLRIEELYKEKLKEL